jgi:hypothetical protein
LFTALFYIMLGFLFTYLAINSGDDTLWSIRTILPALIATFDFGIGLRLLRIHFHIKKKHGK